MTSPTPTDETPTAAEVLAEVTHQDCIDDWQRRPSGSTYTQHGMDAHLEAAKRRVAALAERGYGVSRTGDADLSCLGCGQVREPSTWDAQSHAYLCVECVGAIRVRKNPGRVEQLLSDHFAGLVMPMFYEWDMRVRYASGLTTRESTTTDPYRKRLADFLERLLDEPAAQLNQAGRKEPERG